MQPLEHPDIFHFQAAIGWLELGNHAEAGLDLERLSPAARAHPEVMAVSWQVSRQAKQWERCLEIGRMLAETLPGEARGWVFYAQGLYFLNRIEDAYALLKPKLAEFPESWQAHYDAACYACLRGDPREADDLLNRAMALGDAKQIRAAALRDPDFKDLWSLKPPAEP